MTKDVFENFREMLFVDSPFVSIHSRFCFAVNTTGHSKSTKYPETAVNDSCITKYLAYIRVP